MGFQGNRTLLERMLLVGLSGGTCHRCIFFLWFFCFLFIRVNPCVWSPSLDLFIKVGEVKALLYLSVGYLECYLLLF